MALPLGHIAPKAQHPQPLAARIEEGHLAHLKAGRVAIGIGHPLLIGARSVAGKHLLIGLLDPGGDLRWVDILGTQADQLPLLEPNQGLHRMVAAGEHPLLVAVVDEIGRAVDEGEQQGAALL